MTTSDLLRDEDLLLPLVRLVIESPGRPPVGDRGELDVVDVMRGDQDLRKKNKKGKGGRRERES